MSSLVAVVGPTGSGKSELALFIAGEFAGEVVNCDSVQVYRGFDVGTAKLPVARRRGIPHHLIDIADANEVFTAGEFARRARVVLAEIAVGGRLPIVTGGTGFYLRALLEGLTPGPVRDPPLRERLARREKSRPQSLHRLLRRLDPAGAARIHANDVPRTMRAIEIRLLANTPATLLFEQGREALAGFEVLKFGLFPPRNLLYERLDRRCERMFEEGLIEEVRSLLARGVPASAKPFEALGYRQAMQVVRGELELPEAIQHTKQATRNYAKRQITWFRRERDLITFEGFGDDPVIQAAIAKLTIGS